MNSAGYFDLGVAVRDKPTMRVSSKKFRDREGETSRLERDARLKQKWNARPISQFAVSSSTIILLARIDDSIWTCSLKPLKQPLNLFANELQLQWNDHEDYW